MRRVFPGRRARCRAARQLSLREGRQAGAARSPPTGWRAGQGSGSAWRARPLGTIPRRCGRWRSRRGSGIDVRSEGVPGTHAARQRLVKSEARRFAETVSMLAEQPDRRLMLRSPAVTTTAGARLGFSSSCVFRSKPIADSGRTRPVGRVPSEVDPIAVAPHRYRRGAGRRLALLQFSRVETSCSRAMAKVEAPRDVGRGPCRSVPGANGGMTA